MLHAQAKKKKIHGCMSLFSMKSPKKEAKQEKASIVFSHRVGNNMVVSPCPRANPRKKGAQEEEKIHSHIVFLSGPIVH